MLSSSLREKAYLSCLSECVISWYIQYVYKQTVVGKKKWFLKSGYRIQSPGLYVSVTDIKFPLRTQTVDQTPLVGPTTTDVIATGTCGHFRQGTVITIICLLVCGAQKHIFNNLEKSESNWSDLKFEESELSSCLLCQFLWPYLI